MKIVLCAVMMCSQAVWAKSTVKAPAVSTTVSAVKELKAAPAAGKVEFEAVGKPSFLKIKGEGEGPQGHVKLDKNVTGEFTFKLSTLVTGIALRDTHMKDKYLQVGQYPEATLKLQEVTGWDVSKAGAKSIPFKGTLKIHGVEKPVTGTVDIQTKGNGYEVAANFEAKISDFSIDIPSYAGITVADNVKVTVKSELL